jgi:hypothetical protein
VEHPGAHTFDPGKKPLPAKKAAAFKVAVVLFGRLCTTKSLRFEQTAHLLPALIAVSGPHQLQVIFQGQTHRPSFVPFFSSLSFLTSTVGSC